MIKLIFIKINQNKIRLKKLTAVVVLIVYLFNIGGQLVLHQYFAYLSDKFFNEQTSKGLYNVNDLTEVKLPYNMPGITDWKNYENISGQIQFENVSYNYVKMKITRTAMYLMCVPDYATTHLANQNIIGANQVKHQPIPKKDHVPFSKTTLPGKFNFAFIQFNFSAPFISTVAAAVQPVQQLHHHSTDIPEQPPKFSC
jgi:hypothetical protein